MGMFIICLFGGWLGIHKFIEKKTGLGILYLFTGGLLGVGWIIDTVKYLIEWLNNKPTVATPTATPVINTPVITESVPVSKPVVNNPEPVKEVIPDPESITEEKFNKMKNMCKDIHKEYKELLKEYKDADTHEKVYILKECYRKLDVMQTTVLTYNCYDDLDTFEEMEKIEKKAKSFINAYIKEQREENFEDYEIDVTQFVNDLDFIDDYIYEKDSKLNKY